MMDSSTKEIIDLNSMLEGKKDLSEVKNILRVFLVNRAHREAVKMDDLQEALEVMQRKYIQSSMKYMKEHDDDSAILYLPEMIKNISQYLKDSGDSIKSVMTNSELFDKICIVNQGDTVVQNVTIASTNLDTDSRRRVRNVLNEILKVASEDIIEDSESTVE